MRKLVLVPTLRNLKFTIKGHIIHHASQTIPSDTLQVPRYIVPQNRTKVSRCTVVYIYQWGHIQNSQEVQNSQQL
nr:unnamed protein product [Callosobruchus analis]